MVCFLFPHEPWNINYDATIAKCFYKETGLTENAVYMQSFLKSVWPFDRSINKCRQCFLLIKFGQNYMVKTAASYNVVSFHTKYSFLTDLAQCTVRLCKFSHCNFTIIPYPILPFLILPYPRSWTAILQISTGTDYRSVASLQYCWTYWTME